MADLSTHYLGLTLKNPLVVSASPLSEDVANIKKIEDAGGAAVVFHSLFEEQLAAESNWLDHHLSHGEHYAEAISYFPERESYRLGPEGYLEQIRRGKDRTRFLTAEVAMRKIIRDPRGVVHVSMGQQDMVNRYDLVRTLADVKADIKLGHCNNGLFAGNRIPQHLQIVDLQMC